MESKTRKKKKKEDVNSVLESISKLESKMVLYQHEGNTRAYLSAKKIVDRLYVKVKELKDKC